MIEKLENGFNNCPACQSLDVQELVDEKLVTFLFPVPKSTISKINREKISIFICNSCSHVFQVNVNKIIIDTIYSNFYQHYNLDTSFEFQKIYRNRTQKFINDNIRNDTKNSDKTENLNILDIGCGEGTYFPFFSDHGYDCYGFEPSKKSIIAKNKNPDAIINSSYFENHADNIFNVQFNVILLNWVLEHVLDLDNFFSVLVNYCKKGTKIFLQVPDLLYYVEHDLFLFYVHEHIQYFTLHSLSYCLNRVGFRIISYKNADCPSLLVVAEYIGKEISPTFNNDVEQTIRNINNFIQKGNNLGEVSTKLFDKYNEIFFYGIGTSTYWLGEYHLANKIKGRVKIIDDNKFYINKYVPSFECRILQVDEIGPVNGCAFFIGTSPVYRDTIITRIQENVSGEYDIVFIDNNKFKVINKSLISQ